MESAIGSLDVHVTGLADARATAGARLARLETEGERLVKASLANETDLSKLESLDMAEGIARLNRLMTVLRAAQGSFIATTNLRCGISSANRLLTAAAPSSTLINLVAR